MNKRAKREKVFAALPRQVALGAFLILAFCLVLGPGQPFAEIHDGASGGNEHFFFLSPLVPFPSSAAGLFDASQTPVVEICEWNGTNCVLPLIARFIARTEASSAPLTSDPEEEVYIVNWRTKRFNLDETKVYRIRVLFTAQEKFPISKELGHIDVLGGSVPTLKDGTLPIKFRIEEGFFPIGELTPMERAKISPVLIEQFISQDVIEPVEALVNLVDDQIPLPDLIGVEVLTKYKHLAKAFIRISDSAALASLAQSNNVKYVYENGKYQLFSEWQEIIGQPLIEISGYIGTGTAVAILDNGHGSGSGMPLPKDDWLIDLSRDEFGACTDVGTPASCRVVAMVDIRPDDPYTSSHMTNVASYVALTAPGADLVLIDVGAGGEIDDDAVNLALDWVLEHQAEYNIVAVNMSFGKQGLHWSTETCPTSNDADFKLLREAGVMPIAASGNDGGNQRVFDGVSLPACSQYVVSVGSSAGASSFENSTTRGPNLDLLAPTGPTSTSFAAPQVSGAWAILRPVLPNLSLEETLDLLKTTGVSIFDLKSELTFPRIQLDAALWASDLPLAVYDNGASTHSGGAAVGHLIAADDFLLDVATHVSGASVDVSDGPADMNRRWDGTVEWWLFDDAAGVPGSLIAFGTGVNVKQRNIVESALGFRDFTVDFDFGEMIPLPAGERFWLALHMLADYGRVSVFWDHQGSTVGYPARTGGELIGGVPNFVDGQYAGTSAFDNAFRVWGKR
jgi:hypothetical protein